jgi:ArsR family transcriptional regulator
MAKMTDDEVAKIGKALGDPNRLAIYTQIAGSDELYCGEMHAKNSISHATLSHHLKVLTDLGLITARKERLNMYYRVIPETFDAYIVYLGQLRKTAPGSKSRTTRRQPAS